MNKEYSVCVFGLGTVGFPTATYLQEAGCKVFGYDINPNIIERAKKLIEAGDINEIPDKTEIFIICVSTTRLEEKPLTTNVYDACEAIVSSFNDLD
jgi:UDP-N-acetyl-D-mannosaminuronate dehydrogenase